MTTTCQQWWITGASAGLGRELALQLAAAGHRVYASARSAVDLEALHQLHPDLIVPMPVDVSDAVAMEKVWEQIVPPPTSLDGVILAAGICDYVDELPQLDTASFRRVMDVNFFGVVNACKTALPLLLAAREHDKSRKPVLAGIGSLSSVVGLPRAEAYGASKAAMAYFLDALRCDLGRELDIVVVQPGFVATRMTAANDFAMPFLWDTQRAARHILHKLQGGAPLAIRFPWQLRTLLSLAASLPVLWYRLLAPRLSRQHKPRTSP